MITNNFVSFFRFSTKTEKYEPLGKCEAWVFRGNSISGNQNGDRRTDTLQIRIDIEKIESVTVGDFVFVGECSGKIPEISECRKIMRVLKNNFGAFPHWHIEAG